MSLQSLRRHEPELPVAVLALNDGLAPSWLSGEVERLGATVLWFDHHAGDSALCSKIASLQHTPFDRTFFLDADTLVTAPIRDGFAQVRNGLAFVQFSDWRSDGRTIIKRMARLNPSADELERARSFGPAVNVGTFVYDRGHLFLVDWLEGTRAGTRARAFIPDEAYAQLRLPDLQPGILDSSYGASVKYHAGLPPKIIHYHGDKHDLKDNQFCELWRSARDGLEPSVPLEQMTVVFAADSAYLPTLLRNLPSWRESGALAGRLTHFIHDGSIQADDLERIGADSVSEYTEWRAWDVSTPREVMLNAFALHAPFAVRTPYWIKLDADCRLDPGTRLFESSRWRSYDLVSHRWGYTKPGSWVHALEAWRRQLRVGKQFITDAELAAQPASARTFKWPRFQSFACLHRTDASQRLAALCEGRLPVPSHDTFYWFAAEALGLRVKTLNLKKWGIRHGCR